MRLPKPTMGEELDAVASELRGVARAFYGPGVVLVVCQKCGEIYARDEGLDAFVPDQCCDECPGHAQLRGASPRGARQGSVGRCSARHSTAQPTPAALGKSRQTKET